MITFNNESDKSNGSKNADSTSEQSVPPGPDSLEASSVAPNERKTLRDQLKAHAVKRQRDFSAQVREHESFNRLSKEELAFFQSLRDKERRQEDELNGFLEKKAHEFDKRRKSLRQKTHIRVEKKPRKLKLSKRSAK
ncbi:FYV6 (YNL133C) [Zygosaccharomyces parabailii]|uniref:ZYBA0S12-00144g1_1 n=1 Tax=Zygosaccharomyces bailii (strain CLIB 213 / ATCC 58445 / CBS 680 / BCRC 21525 / NBRC 1098 / NCYC 1416 / NRRL Y-2227) TaxID=1333698 RepID=A0A8J2TAG4_ZYGB2|nr:FYV6 (YNL133C) [Zygosaccharomyces parabailii]CDF91492.1 ZYBA0S12-00144g1_1 [Zygosaccharomyces bailii CLIB 213]CDH11143.1 uncharacterized protein ZBAI_02929 [Zygosaccharomyces bailii ISA1307]